MGAKLVQLGKNGPLVPQLGLGLMGLSYEAYGSIPNDEEKFAFLDRAWELGYRSWDTADHYGDSEELLGRWFKRTGKRNDIFLSTKFSFVKGGAGGQEYAVDSSGEYAKKACNESLRLLGIDSIDLYYLHHANPKTPIEETMRALVELQKEGKIKHIGLSSVSSATLRRAQKVAPVAAVQMEYSIFAVDIEGPTGKNLLETCRELGVAIFAAMPLGRGQLTSTFAQGQALGDHKDRRVTDMPRFKDGNKEKNMKLVSQFKELADKHNCTIAQLAIAWVLKQGDDFIPIPGTKKIKYLEENWAAKDVVLSDEDEAEIRRFVETAEVAGGTVPEGLEHLLYIDTVEES